MLAGVTGDCLTTFQTTNQNSREAGAVTGKCSQGKAKSVQGSCLPSVNMSWERAGFGNAMWQQDGRKDMWTV